MQDPVGHIHADCGEEALVALVALVAAFYRRIPEDDILGPMYPEGDFVGAERRLRDFLVQRCGGPAEYERARGHPRLRMRHAAFVVDQVARDRWMMLMDQALAEVGIPEPAAGQLREFLDGVATFLINR